MLYDPKWETEVKTDPFSLASLIAWLEKQPAEAAYCSTNSGICMIAQWLWSIDPDAGHAIGYDSFMYLVHGQTLNFRHFSKIVFGGTDKSTFGEALERARAMA